MYSWYLRRISSLVSPYCSGVLVKSRPALRVRVEPVAHLLLDGVIKCETETPINTSHHTDGIAREVVEEDVVEALGVLVAHLHCAFDGDAPQFSFPSAAGTRVRPGHCGPNRATSC